MIANGADFAALSLLKMPWTHLGIVHAGIYESIYLCVWSEGKYDGVRVFTDNSFPGPMFQSTRFKECQKAVGILNCLGYKDIPMAKSEGSHAENLGSNPASDSNISMMCFNMYFSVFLH